MPKPAKHLLWLALLLFSSPADAGTKAKKAAKKAAPKASKKAAPKAAKATPKARFRYNAKTGACENASKQKGYNPLDVKRLFGVTLAQARDRKFRPKAQYLNVDAQCVDFRKFKFNAVIKLYYTKLVQWDFRGANFDGARFVFAHMVKVDLRGAKIDRLDIGYTVITGRIDRFTRFPKKPCKATPIKGSKDKQLRCRR